MIEVTLVPTTQVGKPKIAIVLGSIIIAEPDAKRGVWWDEKCIYPNCSMYAIIDRQDIDEFTDVIDRLNYNSTVPLSEEYRIKLALKVKWFRFQNNIIEYIKF